MNKVLPSRKVDIAKKMFSGKKFMEIPAKQPRHPNIDLVRRKHSKQAPAGINLTEQRNKHFSKDAKNSSFGKKVREEEAGWENN